MAKAGARDRLTGQSSGSLQDILLGGWGAGGGHAPFISSPSRLEWAPSCPRGAHTWSPAFKALPTVPAPQHSFLSHEAPLPLKSRQPLAKAQVGAFDPSFRARGQESLPYLHRLLGLPVSQPLRRGLVPASLAAGQGRGCAATSPHETQPMAGSCPGQPGAAAIPAARVTPSHIWFHSPAAWMECLVKAARGALVL